MQPRISMITLGVRDLGTAITFYEQGLGLPRRPMPDDSPVAFFELNGTWLGLFGHDALAQDAGVSADGSGFRGVAMAHNLDSPAEVDALLQQAEAAGANIIKPAQATDWGGLFRALCGSRRAPVGGGLQSALLGGAAVKK